jgi:hypothetical protein
MGQRFQSGAFVQQCFAVHPLCLSLKRIDEQGRLIVACTSCRMMHHMAADQVVARVAAVPVDGDMSGVKALPTAEGTVGGLPSGASRVRHHSRTGCDPGQRRPALRRLSPDIRFASVGVRIPPEILGVCPSHAILLRQTSCWHLRRSRLEKILNVFQRIRLRFFRACGLASTGSSFASQRRMTRTDSSPVLKKSAGISRNSRET